MAGVDDSYREVDDVFRANRLGEMESSFSDAKMRVGPDGVYMEIFANKVLPFDVASTGTAAWKYFAKSMEHMPFRFFYQKDPQVNFTFVSGKMGVCVYGCCAFYNGRTWKPRTTRSSRASVWSYTRTGRKPISASSRFYVDTWRKTAW